MFRPRKRQPAERTFLTIHRHNGKNMVGPGVTIYHNPRCSKSRQTLQLLMDRGIAPTVMFYLETPPSKDELQRILELLGIQARDLIRKKEKEYKQLGLNDSSLSDATLIDAMLDTPILIERPIVVANGKAALGRPPDNVLEIL